MSKEIYIGFGQKALIDDQDYDMVSKYKWRLVKNHGNKYAVRTFTVSTNHRVSINMGRYILGLKYGDPLVVDHINRNGLDNRRNNLRVCTVKENLRNRGKFSNGISKYKGVYFVKSINKWRAAIGSQSSRTRQTIGYFQTEELAANAYNEKSKELYGEFSFQNKLS